MTPVLLIPGLNCTGRVYREAMEALWPHAPVSVANHLVGNDISGIAAEILARAPARFALAGFSFGGYLAFEILRQAPERVARLALIDTSARPDSAEQTDTRRRRITLAEAGKFGHDVQQSFPVSVHPANRDRADLLAIHTAMALGNGPEAYVRQQRAIIARPDSLPGLAAIRVPTLVLVGAEDEITPPDTAREMHAAIAGSRLVIVEGAGHMAPIEQPQAVAAELVSWIAD